MLAVVPEQESRLQDYCATSVFTQVLLFRGYGFDDQSFRGVSFQKEVREPSETKNRLCGH